MSARNSFFFFVSAAIVAAIALTGCNREGPGKAPAAGARPSPGVPVRVTQAVRRDVPLEVRAIGNAEAYTAVAVKSRVAGQLMKVHIRDGQDVKKGDLLFEIDPLPLQEQVRQAEANIAQNRAIEKQAEASVARDKAQAANARSQSERFAKLATQGIVSRDQNEQYRTVAEAADATVAADQAAVESARAAIRADEARLADTKLQLSYARIHAPIGGRVGVVELKEGNLIKENDTSALVNILQVMPIHVSFAVPEQNLAEIRRYLRDRKLQVEASIDQTNEPPSTGTLDFIDNMVDSTTGTIRLKAVFPNTNLRLWPGQFVNVTLRLSTDRDLLVIPSQAVQTSQKGRYVWAVKPDGTADLRPVEVVRVSGDLSVVGRGLTEGEKVVIEGQSRIMPGARLEMLKSTSMSTPPSSTPPQKAGGEERP